MTGEETMNGFESALRRAGYDARVEARERLAIVILAGDAPTGDDRRRIVQLARAEGFTHVSLELDPHGAALPGR